MYRSKFNLTLIITLLLMISIGYSQDVEHFEYVITGDNMSIIVTQADLNGEALVPDDEIGVFNPQGVCSGATVIPDGFPDERAGLAAWAEEDGNGFEANEELEFRFWDHEADFEIVADAERVGGQQDVVFSAGGFLVVELSAEGEQEQDGLVLSGDAHDFGEVAVNAAAEWVFSIANPSDEDIEIESVVTTGGVFTDDIDESFTIESGDTSDVTVTFAPESEGNFDGTVTITTADDDEYTVELTGAGIANNEPPDIGIDPGAIDFGDIVVGESEISAITVTNNGDEQLVIENAQIEGDGFSVDFNAEDGITVEAGESVEIEVTFSPEAEQEYNGTLTITSNDEDDGEVDVALTGVGVEWLPHFRFVITGDNMSIIINQADLNGEPLVEDDEIGVFTEAGTCGGAGIVPDGFPDERVGMAAWAEEDGNGFEADEPLEFRFWDHEAEFEIVADAERVGGQQDVEFSAGGFLVVDLSAEGGQQQDVLELSDDAHDFGEVVVDEAAEWTFIITNVFDEDVEIESVVTTGGVFTDDIDESFTLEPDSTIEVSVTFAPESEGDFDGMVTITTVDDDEFTVELTGSGIADHEPPDIGIDPGAIDFGEVLVGNNMTSAISVTNNGDEQLVIENAQIDGDGFSVEFDAENGVTIEAGESVDIDVTFSPEDVEEYNGTLTITSNDPDDGEIDVALSGMGVEELGARIVVSPGELDFGDVPVGGERSMTIEISNTGDDVLLIESAEIDNEAFTSNIEDFVEDGEHFDFVITTDSQSIIVLEALLNDEDLAEGNEIGVFTPDGLCVGASIVEDVGESLGLAAWPDDRDSDEIDGFDGGDEMAFFYWDAESFREVATDIEFVQGDEEFVNNGFTVVNLTANAGLDPVDVAQVPIQPNETIELTIIFSPDQEAEFNGVLTIVSNDENNPEIDVALSGAGIEESPDIELSTDNLAFANVLVGDDRVLSFLISNTGDALLTVESVITDGEIFTDDSDEEFELEPGDSVRVSVTFAPGESGDFEGVVTITSDDADNGEITVALSGTGVDELGARIVVSVDTLDFGDVEVGGERSMTIEISNTGDALLLIESADIDNEVFTSNIADFDEDGEHFEFIITTDSQSIIVLEALLNDEDLAEGNEIGVFTPDGLCVGASIVEDAGESLGLAAWPDDRESEELDGFDGGDEMAFFYWDAESFREVATDIEFVQGDEVFVNNGFTVVNLSADAGLDPVDIAQVPIQPDETIELTITFTPSDVEEFEGMITFVSNDENSPEVEVNLIGMGVGEAAGHLVVTPEEIDFGAVLIGFNEEFEVSLRNDGNAELLIESVELDGANFSIVLDEEEFPISIDPGDNWNFFVTFAPEEAGDIVGSITITSNDPDVAEFVIDLMGEGIQPQPEIEIDDIDGGLFQFNNERPFHFGEVLVDNDREWEFLISNSGFAVLEVTLSTEGDGFSVNPDGQIEIAVGASENVMVTFAPDEVAEYEGVLHISSNDPNQGELDIELGGFGVAEELPHIVIHQDELNFGRVIAGEMGEMFLTGENIGAGELRIIEIFADSDNFYSDMNDEIIIVDPGEEFSFVITFAPENVEEYTATLTIASDDENNEEIEVELIGVGIADEVHFEFVITDENMSAIIRAATLDGESLVEGDEIGSFTPDGICAGAVLIGEDGGDNFPAGLALWSDDNITEEVEGFQAGEEISWRVWDAAAQAEYDAFAEYSMGEGIFQANDLIALTLDANREETPRIRIDAEEHDFGRVLINVDRTWTIEISNLGDGVLEIESMVIEEDGFEVRGFAENTEIDPQGSLEVQIAFHPEAVEAYEGILVINSNDPENPQIDIGLTGEGIEPADPAIEVSEMEHDFGDVVLLEDDMWELTIRNIGADVLTIDRLELDGDGFAIDQEEGFELGIDESRIIMVTFTPEDEDNYAATLSILSNDPENEIIEVSLTGTGILPELRWNYTITDISMPLLILEVLLQGEQVAFGGQVGVFTPDNLCAGVILIDDDTLGLAAWADDDETEEIDGFEEGEELFFRIWDDESQTEMEGFAEYVEGEGNFDGDSFAVLNLEAIPPDGFVHFHGVIETENNHTLLIRSAELERGTFLEIGDEVGVFTPAGLLAGSYVLEEDGEEPFAITAWGDDADTEEIDGFRNGEEFTFYYWDSDAMEEIHAQGDLWDGDDVWVNNGFTQINLELFGANHPPDWIDIPEMVEGIEEEMFEFTVEGMDRDGDDVAISAESENLPDGWEVEDHGDGTATFTWTPTLDDAGEYVVTFAISDGDLETTADVSINIENVNQPPIVDEIDDVEVDEDAGVTVLFDLDDIFSDPDGDELTYEFTAEDELGMSLDDDNVLRIETAENYFGETEVTLTADDGFNGGRVMIRVRGGQAVGQMQFGNQPQDNRNPDRDDQVGITFMVNVLPINDAPEVVNGVADVEVEEDVGETVLVEDLNDVFADVDDEDLEFSFEGEDVLNLSLDGSRLTMNPEEHYNGESEVTVTADDGHGDGRVAVLRMRVNIPAQVMQSARRGIRSVRNLAGNNPHRDDSENDEFTVTVTPINDDPFWVDLPDVFNVDEGDLIEFDLTADDFDFLFGGDEDLDIAMTDDDGTGGEFVDNDDNTGSFAWQTGFQDDGQYELTFEVTDRAGATAQATVEITVNNVEQTPEIVEPTDEDEFTVQIDEGDETLIEFGADDLDHEQEDLTWTIGGDDLPADWEFTDIGDGIAEFFIDTNFGQAGRYEFLVTVTDPDGLEDQITIIVIVLNVNQDPIFDEPSGEDEWDVEVNEGEELRFNVHANDGDGGALIYNFNDDNLPEDHDAQIVGNSEFVWTPTFDDGQAVYDVEFTVTDEEDGADNLLVHITVNDVNRRPVVDAPIADIVMQEDDAPLVVGDLDDMFSDPDGDALEFVAEGAPAGITLDIDDENVLTITLDANFNLPGGVDITVTASEVDIDLDVQNVFNLVVEAVNDAPDAFALRSPANGTVIERADWDWSIEFEWDAANDIDGDELTYSFYVQAQYEELDTTWVMDDLVEATYTLTRLDTILSGMGIIIDDDISIEVSWWAEANDGEIATESTERWTLTVPVPNAIDDQDLSLPQDYSLSPVYPNPFNPSANIRFSLPVSSNVSLSVWNLEGRKVSQLIDHNVNAGVHNVRWIAHETPAGVYIILLQVNGQRFTTKGVLVK